MSSHRRVGEIICRIVERDYGAQHVHRHGGDDGLDTPMRHENHIARGDAIHAGSRPHPRCYGTYGRYPDLHVRERSVLSLEACIRQMTSSPVNGVVVRDRDRYTGATPGRALRRQPMSS